MDEIFRPEFADCWRYEGLRDLRPTDALMQLVSIPCSPAMASWTVFRESESHVIVRRLHAPHPGRIGGRHQIVGADGRMGRRNFQEATDRAESFGSSQLHKARFGVDGIFRGVRWPNKPTQSDITWWDGSADSDELNAWFTAATGAFDRALPTYSHMWD